MDFKEFQDEVISTRFDESDRDHIKRWLNLRYQWIWNQADWSFKRPPKANLAVSSATPTMPADFAKALRVYDDQGNELVYVDQNEWEFYSLQPGSTPNRASAYTVIDRQLYLYPTPTSATYKLAYKRRLSHVDATLGVVGGIMIEDTDQPLWPAEHDFVLVLEAVMLGQQLRNDPTWTMLVPARDEALDGMKSDLVWQVEEQVGEQWGASTY